VAFARDAAKDAATQTTQDRVVALLGAVRETVAEEPIPDGVTAAQVLAYRKGGPRGRALLLVAGARALKIPAREVRGLAYEGGEHDSYYPHWWAEVEVDGAWLAVDPSASQIPADVAHIRCQPVPDAALPPASSAALTIGAKQ
jgi:transglutaminase-like putative cysteine protease